MFTDMDKWAEIRRRVLVEEESKRSICREFDIHWETLQKILSHEEPPGYRRKQARKRPVLERFVPIIHEILKSDVKSPKKQRHTSQRIFDRLREEHGYTGCLPIVKDEVRAWKNRGAEVFMPLSQLPGHAQVDFGEAQVVLNGERTKVAFFVMSLVYSDSFFVCVFPRECTESFQEGHRRAMEFFGGVPRRISYDNSKIAVSKIVGRRGETPTREFLRLQSHYLFDRHFCLVRRANEKGVVEGMIGFARRNFLVPIPEVDSLEKLNEQLVHRCEKDLSRRLRGKSGTKSELLSEERESALLSLPKQGFEARWIEHPRSNSLSLVRFDCNDYSVPTKYAHHATTTIGTTEEVRIVVGACVVARHRRRWGKEGVFFDPVHYLALLERKPGSLDFAKPLEGWQLPECFSTLRRRLETDLGSAGVREYIKTLRLLEHASVRALASVIEYALEIGATDSGAIGLILSHRCEKPAPMFCLEGRPHLAQVRVAGPNLPAYECLMREGTP